MEPHGGGEAFVSRLREIVGAAHVLSDPADMAGHLVDWRKRYRGAALCVVKPATTAEVSAVVATCAEAGIAIVPQGGNTGMCGGAIPPAAGRSVILALARMNRIREIDAANDTMTVEAGCVLAAIQEAAAGAARLFPMSLGGEGSCQIGGNVATNAGGTAVLRYGPMRALVLGIEAVMPDGRIWNGLGRLRKDNTGYDFNQLLIGSEGTLGIITAVVLKLFPKPRSTATALAALASLEDALSLLLRLRADFGERVTTFEVMCEKQLALVRAAKPELARPIDAPSPWVALVELTDAAQDDRLGPALETALSAALEEGIITDATVAASLSQAADLWRIRHSVTESNVAAGVSVSHDVSVPVSAVPAFVERVDAGLLAALPHVMVSHVGHLGDGNIHVVAIFAPQRYAEPSLIEADIAVANAVVDEAAMALGGSISAEHGIGQSNIGRLQRYKDPLALEFMRGIKALVDPQGIMNPGKLLQG